MLHTLAKALLLFPLYSYINPSQLPPPTYLELKKMEVKYDCTVKEFCETSALNPNNHIFYVEVDGKIGSDSKLDVIFMNKVCTNCSLFRFFFLQQIKHSNPFTA